MDPWVITPVERARHAEQFATLGPVAGFINGGQAKARNKSPVFDENSLWRLQVPVPVSTPLLSRLRYRNDCIR
jgi:hypothetical protein